MSAPARFSQQARREIALALSSMEHANAQQALRLAVETAARRIGMHPLYGRTAPPYMPGPYRFWSLPRFGYVLVYDPQTDPVEILRFVYTRRDLPRLLTEFGEDDGGSDQA